MGNKYLIKVKESEFTIPKENLKMLAWVKMQDRKEFVPIDTEEQVIKYLESLGIKVIGEE